MAPATLSRRDALKLGLGWAVTAAVGCRARRAPAPAPVVHATPLEPWSLPHGTLRRPSGLALLDDGTLVVAESGRHRLRLFDPKGALAGSIGEAGAGPGKWNDPVGVVALGGRDIAVSDRANGRVVTVKVDGKRWHQVGGLGIDDHQFMGPSGLAVGPEDPETDTMLLVVADARNRRVKICRIDGTPRAFLWQGNVPAPAPRLPVDVAMLSNGVCVVADPLAGACFAAQVVTADVRVAFARPGATTLPESPQVVPARRAGFRSRLRLAAAGERVLVADAKGVAVCDAALTVVGRVPNTAFTASGETRDWRPGGLVYDPRTEVVHVSDAASGLIRRARLRLA